MLPTLNLDNIPNTLDNSFDSELSEFDVYASANQQRRSRSSLSKCEDTETAPLTLDELASGKFDD